MLKKIIVVALMMLTMANSASAGDLGALGNMNSQIKVYVFTDWYCLPCRQMDNRLPMWYEDVAKKARIEFVDKAKGAPSEKYIPFNISAMVGHKDQYLKIRKLLKDVAMKNSDPTSEEINTYLQNNGVAIKMLSFGKIDMINKEHLTLIEKYKVVSTPTMVVVNTKSGKNLITVGSSNINKQWIEKAIQELN